MILRKRTLFSIFILLLISCGKTDESSTEMPPGLSPNPEIRTLELTSYYSINVINEEPILPIVTALGDTIIPNGIPLPATHNKVEVATASIPLPIETPNLLVINERSQTQHEPPKITHLRKKQLPISTLNTTKATSTALKNSSGQFITSGTPIFLQPEKVPVKFPISTDGLPFSMKNNARLDIQYLEVKNGVLSSYIGSMIEDQRGYLWIGTTDAGVIRYDGRSFLNFTSQNGLAGNAIIKIYEDSEGKLWFCTNSGVSVYDGTHFCNYSEAQGLSSNHITAITEDHVGNVWLGTKKSGLIKMTDSTAFFLTTSEGLCSNEITALITDQNGAIWAGTNNEGILLIEKENLSRLSSAEGLSHNQVSCLYEDTKGQIWIGNKKNGLDRYDGDSLFHWGEKNGLTSASILCISQDLNGSIWLGSNGGGLIQFSSDKIETYTEFDGLTSNVIRTLYPSECGKLWLGTHGGGLCLFNNYSFQHYTSLDGLSEPFVSTISPGNDGDIWFGTWGGGLSHYDGKRFNNYEQENSLSNCIIRSSIKDSNDNLWFGTLKNGVTMYNGVSFTTFNSKNGLSGNNVTSILEDLNGHIWFGTQGNGATRFDGKSFYHYSIENGLSGDVIRAMVMDEKGGIWLGTEQNGLTYYKDNSFTYYNEQNGLCGNKIVSLFIDDESYLWIGTIGQGLSCFTGESFINYSEKSGLCNNFVKSITEDHEQNIWVGTNNGISCLIKKDSQGRAINNFDHFDGLKGTDFFAGSSYLDTANNLWLGSGKCLSKINLNKINTQSKSQNVQLNSIGINGEFLDFRNRNKENISHFTMDSVKPFYNYPSKLELTYHSNYLTFNFVGIDWNVPQKIQYSYRLVGSSDKWSAPSTNISADYRNISPGNYTFEVRAIGANGLWGEPFQYPFVINPPWWHTWWARTFYILTLIILIYVFIQWRTSRLKKRQHELEDEVQSATKEIREKRDEILDSITYAKRIQSAILPTEEFWKAHLKDAFILYLPKDIVAGDFYWLEPTKNGALFAAADCTGHGVPGALVSVVCNNALNRSVREYKLTSPDKILDKTRSLVVQEFELSNEDVKDGMDIALCKLDGQTLYYSGANNPLWLIRKNSEAIVEIKANKQPVGKFENSSPFTVHSLELELGDTIYIFSDGFADQFGGEKGKKFKTANFKRLLLKINKHSMEEQQGLLHEAFQSWRGEIEQLDDVCVIGVKV